MSNQYSLLLFLFTSLPLFLISLSLASSPPSLPHSQCRDDEASALLQFKQSLTINMCDPNDPSAYPKLGSWKMLGGWSNCCLWDGVECDDVSDHVIGLHRSASCLYGPLSFNTTLSKLSKLVYLDLSSNHFSHSSIPSMSGLFPRLTYLTLSYSHLSGSIPSSISQLSNLSLLHLNGNDGLKLKGQTLHALVQNSLSLPGEIPAYLANLTQLTFLSLHSCRLTGSLPSWLFKLNNLQELYLSSNQLQGLIPTLFSRLPELSTLDLAGNNLSGTVEVDMFLGLEKLTHLFLSDNRLSLIHKNTNATALGRRFVALGLGSCNLQHFPHFLGDQDQLIWLSLSNNNISGQVPLWLWNVTKDTLEVIILAGNFLTGFDLHSDLFPWPQATKISLQDNMFHGPLPMPPTNTTEFRVSGNNFTGQISPKFCSLSSLYLLDLSYNSLSGEIPQCLAYSTSSLQLLDLRGNNLHGTIPRKHTKSCNLKMLALDSNSLTGKLPKSLSKLKMFFQVGWVHFSNLRSSFYGRIASMEN